MKIWEADQVLKKIDGKKYCSVSHDMKNGCEGDIVRAHTIPKSSSLKKIARDGHVYRFWGSVQTFEKTGGRIEPELIGINRASTFTGFCSKHDKEIFAPIEDSPFDRSPFHCFLLSYRALARECFAKKAQLITAETMKTMDRGKSIEEQVNIQEFLDLHLLGINSGMADADRVKELFDKMLVDQNYSDLFYYILDFEDAPEIMTCGGILPEFDFSRNALQDLSDLSATMDVLFYTLYATDYGGAAVFAWHKNSNKACQQFIISLSELAANDVPNALCRFIFEYGENTFIAPDLWESYPDATKQALISRISESISIAKARKKTCLMPDGINYCNWKVIGRHTNML